MDYAAYCTGPRGPNNTADFNECCVTHGPGLARIAAERRYLLRHTPEAGVAATPFGMELP